MKKQYIITLVLFCFALLSVYRVAGQQDPNRSLYRYSMNLVNPAYAGVAMGEEAAEKTSFFDLGVNIRSQWASMEGAPETQSAFFGTPVGSNLGLGVSVINDQTFIENSTSINVDFSYKVRVSEVNVVHLGIKAGAYSYNANLSGLETYNMATDPSLQDVDGSFKPNFGIGALLKGEQFFISMSVPGLLSNDRLEQKEGLASYAASQPHVYLAGGYDFDLSTNFKFRPSTMIRYIKATPISVELTAAFNFKDKFEVGPSYRFKEGFGGLLILNATNWIDVGYAYEAAYHSDIAAQSQGTHEVFLKFRM